MPTEELLQLDMELRASVPPPVMADVMAFMLPAMNVEERVDMLGRHVDGTAAGVRRVASRCARTRCPPTDWAVVADRLGLN